MLSCHWLYSYKTCKAAVLIIHPQYIFYKNVISYSFRTHIFTCLLLLQLNNVNSISRSLALGLNLIHSLSRPPLSLSLNIYRELYIYIYICHPLPWQLIVMLQHSISHGRHWLYCSWNSMKYNNIVNWLRISQFLCLCLSLCSYKWTMPTNHAHKIFQCTGTRIFISVVFISKITSYAHVPFKYDSSAPQDSQNELDR